MKLSVYSSIHIQFMHESRPSSALMYAHMLCLLLHLYVRLCMYICYVYFWTFMYAYVRTYAMFIFAPLWTLTFTHLMAHLILLYIRTLNHSACMENILLSACGKCMWIDVCVQACRYMYILYVCIYVYI